MFETQFKQDGNIDRSATEGLIKSLEERLASIDRQRGTAPEASLPSLEAQKYEIEKRLRDLRSNLESEIGKAA